MSPHAFRRASWRLLVTTGALAALSSAVFTSPGHAAAPTPVQHAIVDGVLYLGTSDAPDLMKLSSLPGGKVLVDMAADGNPELVLDGAGRRDRPRRRRQRQLDGIHRLGRARRRARRRQPLAGGR